jgi:hypothetical protein
LVALIWLSGPGIGDEVKGGGAVEVWSMLLKKSFSTADQNFPRPLKRFSDNYVRDLVSQ